MFCTLFNGLSLFFPIFHSGGICPLVASVTWNWDGESFHSMILFQVDFGNSKRQKFLPNILQWEFDSGFDPSGVHLRILDESRTNYRGEALQSPFYVNRAEHVASGEEFDFDLLPFRDPNCFIAGNLHKHYEEWEKLNPNGEILSWLRDGVNIDNYFKHFKGNFAGKCYDSPSPTKEYFRNSDSCKRFAGFIKEGLVEREKNGSMSVWGRVGECDPPHLVMPLTI